MNNMKGIQYFALLIVLALSASLIAPVFAQEAEETAGIPLLQGPLDAVFGFLNSSKLLPQLNAENNEDQFLAFLMFAVLVWMVLDLFFGNLNSLMKFVFAFVVTSFFFKIVNALFTTHVVEQVFALIFSGMFVLILTEFFIGFAWGISHGTRRLISISVAVIAMVSLNFTQIYQEISALITGLSWAGMALFILFMIAMRIFNTFFSMMRFKAARELRIAGAEQTEQDRKGFRTMFEAQRRIKR